MTCSLFPLHSFLDGKLLLFPSQTKEVPEEHRNGNAHIEEEQAEETEEVAESGEGPLDLIQK